MLVFLETTPFDTVEHKLGQLLAYDAPEVTVGSVHAQSVEGMSALVTRELTNVIVRHMVGPSVGSLQSRLQPNLPWAEDHFKERIGGEPLNPAPSEAWWPYAERGNSAHKKNKIYSHTYPERFWPKYADVIGLAASRKVEYGVNRGIRFEYGDLEDVVATLRKDPLTRQAYLPVFFPEDTGMAAREGERIPCSLGYHFLFRKGSLDCNYFMRSCDFVRYFRDDLYMAARLTQWVWDQMNMGIDRYTGSPGVLTTHIGSLHVFNGDLPKMREQYG